MKKPILAVLTVLVAVFLLWGIWMWFFCRFYVEPGQMAIVVAKTGTPLPPDRILARDGELGIREQVLGEGRHFLNPVFYEYEIADALLIPPGKVGVVTSKVGTNLPSGEFLANPGQKGIWRGTLGPGLYRMNPYGYQIDLIPAISVPIGYVGVVTSLSGEEAPEGEFATANQKGIREDILQPGLYYINNREYKVDVVEVGVNQVSLLGKTGGEVIAKQQMQSFNTAMQQLEANVLDAQAAKRKEYVQENRPASDVYSSSVPRGRSQRPGQADAQTRTTADGIIQTAPVSPSAILTLNQFVEFPSRDGFEISLDMTVEFELLPSHIAWIYQRYGDMPAVVDKIVMPQILSVSRLKGSVYRATDFIVGEGRETFQNDLTETLAAVMGERRITVHNALIRHVNVPEQILQPIQQASVSVEQDLTNKEKQNTARKQAELNTEQTLIQQRSEQVVQETERIKAQVRADQQKDVARIHAQTMKKVAEIEQRTARVHAERARKIGKAEADVITFVQGEIARGFELKTAAFGDPRAYALWEFAENLPADLRISILHSGPGTLWTDLQRATMGDLGGAARLREGEVEHK